MSVADRLLLIIGVLLLSTVASFAQTSKAAALGSTTAKAGFANEDEIAAKFNNWRSDTDAGAWLSFMGYRPDAVVSVSATKPHGEKADIQVRVRTRSGEKIEGISIKLVSTEQGFNQIDKRWLRQYAAKWKMPADVEAALKLFTGEVKPNKVSRNRERMFLNELGVEQQKHVVDFFTAKKTEVVSDLFSGDGQFSAGWMMVASKASAKPRWVLRSIDYTIKFFSEGPVEITRAGNLKIGRITMQRKGGDGGRVTANMLQFKVNPALLFEGNDVSGSASGVSGFCCAAGRCQIVQSSFCMAPDSIIRKPPSAINERCTGLT